MKHRVAIPLAISLFTAFTLAAGLPRQPAAATQPAAPASDTAYSIGFDLGREVKTNLARDGVTADADTLIRGFTDALKAQKPAVAEAQMTRLLADLQKSVDTRRAQEQLKNDPVYRAQAEKAAAASKTFIERFAALKDVKKLDGGVLYQSVKAGDGKPAAGATSIVVNFETFLCNGEMVNHGKALTVSVDQLVPGAVTVINSMKVGDRWYVAIPPDQAFGERGNPPHIGPNEVLIIDVELLEVKQ